MSERPRQEHEERWIEQAAAYALSALDKNEVPEFERHLEGCEVCRSEIRWLRPAVDALPESVPRMEPPPDLRERLLKDVRADARGAQRRRSTDAAEERLTFGAWLARLGSRGWKPLAAAGAAALVVFAFVGYEVGSNGGGDSGGGAPPVAVIPAPRSPEGITSKVVTEGNRGTVHLANVKQLPDNRVLEAWVLRNEQVEPVRTLFVPDKHGDAATEIPNLTGVETVMVTREPKGGSAAPTSAPIATIPLPQT